MSLLIKALDKAQTAKTEQAQADSEKAKQSEVKKKPVEKNKNKNVAESDLELSLSPTGSTLVDAASVADTAPQKIDISLTNSAKITTPLVSTANPVATSSTAPIMSSSNLSPTKVNATNLNAANVFSAKGMDSRNQNKTLAIIAGGSLLALLGMGFYYYQYIGSQPNIVIPPAPITQQAVEQSTVAQETVTQQTEVNSPVPETQLAENSNNEAQLSETTPSAFEPHEKNQEVEKQAIEKIDSPIKKPAKKMPDNLALSDNEAVEVSDEQAEINESAQPIEPTKDVALGKNTRKSRKLQFGEAIASESASISATSINVSKSNPQAAVNPTLMSAYEAYNAGKDVEAQKLYKQVLQRDIRNVDALLGLGAIASRQGRVADANGWYGKVLEVEPRNSLAQSALLDNQLQLNQSQGNPQDAESRLKNMLAKHPNDVNLQVALANLYAEQNQWPSAQQAYFDAYSLNASADNAFNLAVSLDQMGKPKLALPYYQRALEQASGNSNIDRATLEARIAAIQ